MEHFENWLVHSFSSIYRAILDSILLSFVKLKFQRKKASNIFFCINIALRTIATLYWCNSSDWISPLLPWCVPATQQVSVLYWRLSDFTPYVLNYVPFLISFRPKCFGATYVCTRYPRTNCNCLDNFLENYNPQMICQHSYTDEKR